MVIICKHNSDIEKFGTIYKEGDFSVEMHLINGVRQGGVLSPPLFIVYVDWIELKTLKCKSQWVDICRSDLAKA